METAIAILTDVLIIVTLPLHCRYLYVMLQDNPQLSSMEYAFRTALTNIVVANLLHSIVFMLVQEPAALGLFSDFYKSQSTWLGRVFEMQHVPLAVLTGVFHALIALNRLSALCFPMSHAKVWSEQRVKRVLIGCWILAILECIPLIYPYEIFAMGFGGLLEIFVIIIYAIIGVKVSRMKNLPQSTVSMTVCALLVSTGGIVIILIVLPNMLAWRISRINLWSSEMYNALFKFAFAYNNAIAPWVMLFYYRNIRHLLLGRKEEPIFTMATITSFKGSRFK